MFALSVSASRRQAIYSTCAQLPVEERQIVMTQALDLDEPVFFPLIEVSVLELSCPCGCDFGHDFFLHLALPCDAAVYSYVSNRCWSSDFTTRVAEILVHEQVARSRKRTNEMSHSDPILDLPYGSANRRLSGGARSARRTSLQAKRIRSIYRDKLVIAERQTLDYPIARICFFVSLRGTSTSRLTRELEAGVRHDLFRMSQVYSSRNPFRCVLSTDFMTTMITYATHTRVGHRPSFP